MALFHLSLALRLHSGGHAVSSLANPKKVEWPHFNHHPQTNPLISYPANSPRMCMAPRLRWRRKLWAAPAPSSSLDHCDRHANDRLGPTWKLSDFDGNRHQHLQHQRDLECKWRGGRFRIDRNYFSGWHLHSARRSAVTSNRPSDRDEPSGLDQIGDGTAHHYERPRHHARPAECQRRTRRHTNFSSKPHQRWPSGYFRALDP